jgi:hypothetical protein
MTDHLDKENIVRVKSPNLKFEIWRLDPYAFSLNQ